MNEKRIHLDEIDRVASAGDGIACGLNETQAGEMVEPYSRPHRAAGLGQSLFTLVRAKPALWGLGPEWPDPLQPYTW
ncbi:hypothetical protein AMTR_s00058p00033220 [Amborella trichopoda]|uniref:Uncharacterized protein n=1 Tax=Amborella trichopoda TaxID=13333 RepID=W1PFR2_AMBTC|nr:hypothetical protein AMTR_s00058p00033220 [Amborella trichopoda]